MRLNSAKAKRPEGTKPGNDPENQKSAGQSAMEVQGDSAVDILQASLYNAGQKMLRELGQEGMISQDSKETYEAVKNSLQDLKMFYYNIGFAGEQSCGKSTVINSLIRYPLMSTCNLTTTCASTKLIYGNKVRITVNDDDTKKRILDIDCANLGRVHIQKLKEYACAVTHVAVIENIQYFTPKDIFNESPIKVEDLLYFDEKDPKHIAVFMMILLTVYVGQNSLEFREIEKKVNRMRNETLKFFGFPAGTLNYSVQIQWDCELLRCGMVITDLPGLGALAAEKNVNGKVLKGHDDITTEAIQASDAMVFLVDYTVKDVGTMALRKMLSSAKLKDIVNKGNRIIPVLNKADLLKGSAQKETSISKVLSILESVQVKKRAEDIWLYSAIAGEYAYSGIPIERTQYYIGKYAGVYEDTGADFEDEPEEVIQQKTAARIKSRLEKKYNTSNIAELSEFFRASYLERGKYERTKTAVIQIRSLLLDIIMPLVALADSYETAGHLAGNVIDELSGTLSAASDKPIADALDKMSHISIDTKLTELALRSMPDRYLQMFSRALDEYKTENINLINEFSLFWNSARIDDKSSKNYNVYSRLRTQCGTIPFDVSEINKNYGEILQAINEEIEKIYKESLRQLNGLKKDFPEKLGLALRKYEKQIAGNSSVEETLNSLKTSLITYVGKQIDVIEANLKASQDRLSEAGNETANAIIDFNKNITEKYTESVLRDIRNAVKDGALLSSRDYLQIDGSGGVRELFSNLALSKSDRDYITQEVNTIGTSAITNNMTRWTESAKEGVKEPFLVLRGQIRKLLKETAQQLKEVAEGNYSAGKQTKEKMDRIAAYETEFRNAVQKDFDTACQYTDDSVFQSLKGNILNDLLE